MASGWHESYFVDLQLDTGRNSIAAPRYFGGRGDRTGNERPNRFLFLQTSEARQRRAGNGSTAYRGWGSDSHSDRRRELRRTSEGLIMQEIVRH